MPLDNIPHVKRSRIKVRVRLPGENPFHVLVVETDLPLDKDHADYDGEAIHRLKETILHAMPRLGVQEAEIVTDASASTP